LHGNIAINVDDIKAGMKPITHTPPLSQLACTSTPGDRFLDKCLAACIFFIPSKVDAAPANVKERQSQLAPKVLPRADKEGSDDSS
jgi:hypothetical protein